MKYFAVFAAILFLPAIPAASAQSYGCSELNGGSYANTCGSSGSATKIIRVERQARGHPASTGHHVSSAYVDTYSSSQLNRHPGAYAHEANRHHGYQSYPVRHADRAATSYGFEWWASDRYYGRQHYPTAAYRTHQPVRHGHDVSVYHGQAATPCSHHAARPAVTRTYTGCPSAGYQTSQPVTTYSAPVTHSSRAGYASTNYASSQPAYEYEYDYAYEDDYAPVVARSSGYCAQDITRLRDDRDGRERYEVCYRDLSPVVDQDRVEILYSRIAQAADQACDANRGSRLYNRAARRCEDDAVERAVYDTGLEALQRYHLIRTGQGTPRVTVGPLHRY